MRGVCVWGMGFNWTSGDSVFKFWRNRLVGVAVLPKRAPVRKLPLSKVASLAILSRRLVPLALPTSFAFVLVHLGKLQSSIFKSCLLGLNFISSFQISNSYQYLFPGRHLDAQSKAS